MTKILGKDQLSTQVTRPDVFQFDNYQDLLKAFIQYSEKISVARFSLRQLSAKIGMRSPSHLSLVLAGKRPLGEGFALNLAKVLNFSESETAYFLQLVMLRRVPTEHRVREELTATVRIGKNDSLKTTELSEDSLLTEWYLIPLLELIDHSDFQPTREWLQQHVNLPLSPEKMIEGVNALIALGYVVKEGGNLRKTQKVLLGGEKLDLRKVTRFHVKQAQLAAHMIEKIDVKKREANSTTVCIDKNRLEELRRRIKDFQREILRDFGHEEKRDEVVQVNIQMFPITKD